MQRERGSVSAIEALIALLVTILTFLILEVTLGATFDHMANVFASVYIPGLNYTYLNAIGTILGMFSQVHLIAGIMVLMTAVWVIRVVIFGADYTREYRMR